MTDHPSVVVSLVIYDFDVADLYLGAFVHVERKFQRRWRNLLDLWIYDGILAPALGQEILESHSRSLDLIRVVLRLGGKAHLAFLKAVQNFRNGYRFDAFIVNRA